MDTMQYKCVCYALIKETNDYEYTSMYIVFEMTCERGENANRNLGLLMFNTAKETDTRKRM